MEGNAGFRRLTAANFRRGLGVPFFLSVVLVTLFMLFDMGGDLQFIWTAPSKTSVWYYYFESVVIMGTYSHNMLPLLAAVPFAASYCIEQQNGITPFVVARSSGKSYCVSKTLVCAVTGGLTLACGELLFIVLLSTRISLLSPDALTEMKGFPFYAFLTTGTGIGYFLIGMYLAFLRGAIMATVALTVSAYFLNKYVAIASPFIFHFIVVQLCGLVNFPAEARLDLMLLGRASIGSDGGTLGVATVASLLIILFLGVVFTRQAKRRITYEIPS